MISEFSERYTGCCATKSFEKQKVNVGINQKDDAGLWDTSTPTTSGRKIKNTTHICISSPSPLPLFIAWAHCYEFAPGLIGLMNINLFSRDDKLFFKNFHNKWLTLCLFVFFFPHEGFDEVDWHKHPLISISKIKTTATVLKRIKKFCVFQVVKFITN